MAERRSLYEWAALFTARSGKLHCALCATNDALCTTSPRPRPARPLAQWVWMCLYLKYNWVFKWYEILGESSFCSWERTGRYELWRGRAGSAGFVRQLLNGSCNNRLLYCAGADGDNVSLLKLRSHIRFPLKKIQWIQRTWSWY